MAWEPDDKQAVITAVATILTFAVIQKQVSLPRGDEAEVPLKLARRIVEESSKS